MRVYSEGLRRCFERRARSGDGRGPAFCFPPVPPPRTRRAGWRKSIGVRPLVHTGFPVRWAHRDDSYRQRKNYLASRAFVCSQRRLSESRTASTQFRKTGIRGFCVAGCSNSFPAVVGQCAVSRIAGSDKTVEGRPEWIPRNAQRRCMR